MNTLSDMNNINKELTESLSHYNTAKDLYQKKLFNNSLEYFKKSYSKLKTIEANMNNIPDPTLNMELVRSAISRTDYYITNIQGTLLEQVSKNHASNQMNNFNIDKQEIMQELVSQVAGNGEGTGRKPSAIMKKTKNVKDTKITKLIKQVKNEDDSAVILDEQDSKIPTVKYTNEFNHINIAIRNKLSELIIQPILMPSLYKKSFNCILLYGLEGVGKRFVISKTLDKIQLEADAHQQINIINFTGMKDINALSAGAGPDLGMNLVGNNVFNIIVMNQLENHDLSEDDIFTINKVSDNTNTFLLCSSSQPWNIKPNILQKLVDYRIHVNLPQLDEVKYFLNYRLFEYIKFDSDEKFHTGFYKLAPYRMLLTSEYENILNRVSNRILYKMFNYNDITVLINNVFNVCSTVTVANNIFYKLGVKLASNKKVINYISSYNIPNEHKRRNNRLVLNPQVRNSIIIKNTDPSNLEMVEYINSTRVDLGNMILENEQVGNYYINAKHIDHSKMAISKQLDKLDVICELVKIKDTNIYNKHNNNFQLYAIIVNLYIKITNKIINAGIESRIESAGLKHIIQKFKNKITCIEDLYKLSVPEQKQFLTFIPISGTKLSELLQKLPENNSFYVHFTNVGGNEDDGDDDDKGSDDKGSDADDKGSSDVKNTSDDTKDSSDTKEEVKPKEVVGGGDDDVHIDIYYGSKKLSEISSEFASGIKQSAEANTIRKAIISLIQTTHPKFTFQTFDIEIESFKINYGYTWKLNTIINSIDINLNDLAFKVLSSGANEVQVSTNSGLLLSGNDYKLDMNYHITNESDVDILQENFPDDYHQVYRDDEETWKFHHINNQLHVDKLNDKYNNEQQFYLYLYDILLKYQLYNTPINNSDTNDTIDDIITYFVSKIDMILFLTQEYDADGTWNKLWNYSSNHHHKKEHDERYGGEDDIVRYNIVKTSINKSQTFGFDLEIFNFLIETLCSGIDDFTENDVIYKIFEQCKTDYHSDYHKINKKIYLRGTLDTTKLTNCYYSKYFKTVDILDANPMATINKNTSNTINYNYITFLKKRLHNNGDLLHLLICGGGFKSIGFAISDNESMSIQWVDINKMPELDTLVDYGTQESSKKGEETFNFLFQHLNNKADMQLMLSYVVATNFKTKDANSLHYILYSILLNKFQYVNFNQLEFGKILNKIAFIKDYIHLSADVPVQEITGTIFNKRTTDITKIVRNPEYVDLQAGKAEEIEKYNKQLQEKYSLDLDSLKKILKTLHMREDYFGDEMFGMKSEISIEIYNEMVSFSKA
jgi:hypothetical protein